MDRQGSRSVVSKAELCRPGTFTSLPLAILADPELTPAAKLVAAAILNCLRPDETTCFPSIARLADTTALGRRTVIDALAALEGRGHVEIEKQAGRGNRYAFTLPELDALVAPSEGQGNLSDVPAPARPPTGDLPPSPNVVDPDDLPLSSVAGPAVGPVQNPHPARAKSARVPVRNRHRSRAKSAPLHKQGASPTHKRRARSRKPTLLEGPLVEQIEAAHVAIFGVGIPGKWYRAIGDELETGDPALLWRIDEAAIRAGAKLASDQGGTFGFGWILRHLGDQARADKERDDAKVRAAAAAEEAERDRQAAAELRRVIGDHFAGLDAAEREQWREEARQSCKGRAPRPELIDALASQLAYNAAVPAGKGEQ